MRYLYCNHRKLYNVLNNIRCTVLLFFGQYDKWYAVLKEQSTFIPLKNSCIEITWLPNPKNNKHVKNTYIGSRGIVEDVFTDGSIYLRMGTGNSYSTLVVGPKYKFKYISSIH